MSAKKNQVKIEILKKGDTVLNVWENHIAILKKSGEVEVFVVEIDDDGLPRIAKPSYLVTYGKGSISATIEGTDIEVTTY